MLNIKDTTLSLKRLGFSPDEAKVYLTLLEQPMSHLEIARKSGVNRTKVYRIADELIKRGLITEEMNDQGRELAVADPANLEITLITAEEKLKSQREIYKNVFPALKNLYDKSNQPNSDDFVVNTYEGTDGFKHMLWNELKAEDELLIFGSGAIQDLINSPRWAEKHRAKTLEAGYTIREILNPHGKPVDFTANEEFVKKAYQRRYIDTSVLPLQQQVCIYNHTVSIYNWRNGQKVGTEIINESFTNMQRATFERYWKLAQ